MPKAASRKSDAVHIAQTKTSAVATTTSTTIELPENSHIVQPSYIEKNTGKVNDNSSGLARGYMYIIYFVVDLSDHSVSFLRSIFGWS